MRMLALITMLFFVGGCSTLPSYSLEYSPNNSQIRLEVPTQYGTISVDSSGRRVMINK